MAEYIDREKIQWHCEYENPHLCNKEDCKNNCPNLECSYQEVMQIPKADAIERSEYEKLRLVNLDLAETNKGLLGEHEQLVKLRSKIDKAIEEIEDLNLSWVASHYEDRFYGFQQEVLEILKRNIGD